MLTILLFQLLPLYLYICIIVIGCHGPQKIATPLVEPVFPHLIRLGVWSSVLESDGPYPLG